MATIIQPLWMRTKIAMTLSILFVAVWATSLIMSLDAHIYRCTLLVGAGGVAVYTYTQDNLREERLRWYGAAPICWLPFYDANAWPSCSLATFIPFWCIAPFVFIPTFLLWRKDRRIPEGHCRKCGYNLTGNVSGRCSECGQPIGG